MIDPSNLPPGTPVWVVSAVVLGGFFLTFSERAAKLKGPLGAAARWWNTKQEREIDRADTIDNRIESAAARRYGKRMADMEAEMSALRKDLEDERADRKRERSEMLREHRAELERVRVERDLFAAWSEHLLAWWRAQSQWLAAQGVKLPPPPLPTFAEFRVQWTEVPPIDLGHAQVSRVP